MAVDLTFFIHISSEKLEAFAYKEDLRSWVLARNTFVAAIRNEGNEAIPDEDDWFNTCIEGLGEEDEDELQPDEQAISDGEDETESEEDDGPGTPEMDSLRPPFYGRLKPAFFIHEDDDDDDSKDSDDECIMGYDKPTANNMNWISDRYHWSTL